MEKKEVVRKVLVKGNIKREFGERAAKIAVDLLGWVELTPVKIPEEIGTKTKPPEVKPIKLIMPPVVKDDVKEMEEVAEVTPKEVKKRKPRVTSKSTK